MTDSIENKEKLENLSVDPEINLDDDKDFQKAKEISRSSNTRDKYYGDWKKFETYCKEIHNPGFDPNTLSTVDKAEKISAKYISWLQNDEAQENQKGKSEIEHRKHIKQKQNPYHTGSYKFSTLKRKLASLKHYFRANGLNISTKNEYILTAMDGASQKGKKSKQNKAFEILKSHLMLIVDSIPEDDNLTNIRDRALILFGWYSCCRRSEILSLTVEDLDKKINPDGHIIVKIPYSKTDQSGKGSQKLIPFKNDDYCPVNALNKWLKVARIEQGPLFYRIRKITERKDKKDNEKPDSIKRILKYANKKGNKISLSDSRFVWILKERAKKAGINEYDNISGHSLRRGFITESSIRGFDVEHIKLASGHESRETVSTYTNIGDLKNSPALKI